MASMLPYTNSQHAGSEARATINTLRKDVADVSAMLHAEQQQRAAEARCFDDGILRLSTTML
eukprot:CAMPEP_0183575838 /NCGR_PEP_ID=MMETSP0371-20130417/136413_1 /TAXON_ID=268820 /ORGANISM="Peridinium aciculiferum, Strain PAER-2" /LENGTH=61 /DNA_ID=CAMNT_0025786039 /DNA_START=20 /DNA_END=205 /DNA_ORIENTATION=-